MPGKAQPSTLAISELLIWRMCGAWPKTLEIRVRVDFEMAELSAGDRFLPPPPAGGGGGRGGGLQAEGHPPGPGGFNVGVGRGGEGTETRETEQNCGAAA